MEARAFSKRCAWQAQIVHPGYVPDELRVVNAKQLSWAFMGSSENEGIHESEVSNFAQTGLDRRG